MDRIKRQLSRWADVPPAVLAARAAEVVLIAVVPGGFAVWLAYRLIRARTASA
jgi:hypothetical protein